MSTSIDASGSLRLQRADRRRVVACAAVGDVVAVDRRDDDVLQAHLRRGLREAERLERVRRLSGLPECDVAVAAGAGARVAEDLERRRPAAPALADVRAAGLLADRVQARAVDQLADVEVARVRARRAHLHPLGAAWPLGDGERGAPCGWSLVGGLAWHRRGQSRHRRGQLLELEAEHVRDRRLLPRAGRRRP